MPKGPLKGRLPGGQAEATRPQRSARQPLEVQMNKNQEVVYVTDWIETKDGWMKLYGKLRSSLAAWADQHQVGFKFMTEEELENEKAESRKHDFFFDFTITHEFISIGC